SGVVGRQKQLDPMIRNALTDDWPLSRLDSTLRAILRAGVFELTTIKDLPPAVVISEYVDIARAFYEDGEEPRLVNAVLDRIAKDRKAGA
ncbi:MAG: transcription antitermination factor NusB, partial [Oricola sp.]|nr:transcription antitermination factor NusB [Oricola sp.]